MKEIVIPTAANEGWINNMDANSRPLGKLGLSYFEWASTPVGPGWCTVGGAVGERSPGKPPSVWACSDQQPGWTRGGADVWALPLDVLQSSTAAWTLASAGDNTCRHNEIHPFLLTIPAGGNARWPGPTAGAFTHTLSAGGTFGVPSHARKPTQETSERADDDASLRTLLWCLPERQCS